MDIERIIEQRKLELEAESREEQLANLRESHRDAVFSRLITPEGLPINDTETPQPKNSDGLNFLRMSTEAKDALRGFVRSHLKAGVSPPYIEQGWTTKKTIFSSEKQSYGTHGWLMPIGRLSRYYDERSVGPSEHKILPAIVTPRYTLALPLTRFMSDQEVDCTDDAAVHYSEEKYTSRLNYFKKGIFEISPATDLEKSHVVYAFIDKVAVNGVVNRLAQTGVRWSST